VHARFRTDQNDNGTSRDIGSARKEINAGPQGRFPIAGRGARGQPDSLWSRHPDMSRPLDIYCIAIGGTGMAPLACLLQSLGHRVRGSDGPLYPPMSDLLARAGIVPHVGYDPAHLHPAPDLVVVGNVVSRTNVEVVETERLELERVSMPQALARFLLADRRPIVVAGTHGKTTTSAMLAWVYTHCGRDPGYLIGGAPRDLPGSFRVGTGERFVVEGDEYNAAYFDRGAKFLHYRAESLVLTSIEYDHADLYPTEERLIAAFAGLVDLVPAHGLLVACHDYASVRAIESRARCRLVSYSARPGGAEVAPLRPPMVEEDATCFELDWRGDRVALRLPLFGSHNVGNAAAAFAIACADGLVPSQVAAALSTFHGVRRRLEKVGRAGDVVVVDDFAKHPTEVEKSLEGLRAAHPTRRLVALFEPRSLTSCRSFLHDAYLEAFARADVVILAPVYYAARFDAAEILDLPALAQQLVARGVATRSAASYEEVLRMALETAQPGDVLVVMSSGSFDDLPRRLLRALGGS
jgi:UDP-N-acetylmuramate: L-alanyl-gamma-D-glutamyl-meso-diaminopimelate ligase